MVRDGNSFTGVNNILQFFLSSAIVFRFPTPRHLSLFPHQRKPRSRPTTEASHPSPRPRFSPATSSFSPFGSTSPSTAAEAEDDEMRQDRILNVIIDAWAQPEAKISKGSVQEPRYSLKEGNYRFIS